MKFWRKPSGEASQGSEAEGALGGLDQLTRKLAISLPRRRFFQRALAITSAVTGLTVLNPLPAFADDCGNCYGSCTGLCGGGGSTCQSCANRCCSPNGQVCENGGCCPYSFNYAWVKACNSGSKSAGCGFCLA
jgi:hypothetical protein